MILQICLLTKCNHPTVWSCRNYVTSSENCAILQWFISLQPQKPGGGAINIRHAGGWAETNRHAYTGCVWSTIQTGTVGFEVHCAHARPPGAIAADYSRLSSATPGHHRGLRDLTRYRWRQRCQIMVVQALIEQIPEPIVFWFVTFWFVTKCVIYYMVELKDWRQRNAIFFHLYENLKLQDRLI